MHRINLILLALIVLFACSCSKDEKNNIDTIGEEIEFGISFSGPENSLKSASSDSSLSTLEDAIHIVLTIKTLEGEETKYTSTKVDINKMNGEYFSSKLSLMTDDYQITEFYLIDNNNNTIFAAPYIGSNQAQNVNNPLPLLFSISKDQITILNMEVLATNGLSPEDFGLVGFYFTQVPTFSFLINVSEIGQMDSLLTASIEISSGTYKYNQPLEAIANNVVTIREDFSDYNLLVIKNSFVSYQNNFSIDSLKSFVDSPLTIELERELVEVVSDVDGNVYNTVKIGDQIWMKENLKTTHYSDGTPLIDGTGAGNITGDYTTKYYFAYNDDEGNIDNCGRLYTWAAVMNDDYLSVELPIQGVCPVGWHVPNDEEWKQLEMFLGMSKEDADTITYRGTDEGSKLAGRADLWRNSVLEENSAFGLSDFTAVPTGYRYNNGSYDWFDFATDYWSSTESTETKAMRREIRIMNTNIRRRECDKDFAFSVRCIKD